ncbi:MAG: EcsC family protein [Gluconacetobacter diazotrophicus]|nr:EcsC family protein [Gluconacetobacter diazotrophicus]
MSATTGSELSHPGAQPSLSLGAGARDELRRVLEQLESGRGVLVRLADLMGGAVGHATRLGARGLGLAPDLQNKLRGIAESAISRAFDVAVLGLRGSSPRGTSARSGSVRPGGDGGRDWRHHVATGAVAVSGAVGGFGGITGLAPDIGFTTLAIMREIARIAREEGEDLSTPDGRRACLEVFALKPMRASGDESELGYFSSRAVLRGRPVVMLLSEVSSHYGLALSRKLSLQMMPVAGALCGASLNAAFLQHYRSLARAHFTIRRLERTHGTAVRQAVDEIRDTLSERVATT